MVSLDTWTDVFKEKGFVTLLSFKSIDFASTTFLSALKLTQRTMLCIRLIWIQTAREGDEWQAGWMDGAEESILTSTVSLNLKPMLHF